MKASVVKYLVPFDDPPHFTRLPTHVVELTGRSLSSGGAWSGSWCGQSLDLNVGQVIVGMGTRLTPFHRASGNGKAKKFSESRRKSLSRQSHAPESPPPAGSRTQRGSIPRSMGLVRRESLSSGSRSFKRHVSPGCCAGASASGLGATANSHKTRLLKR